jgi:hypothetical protein
VKIHALWTKSIWLVLLYGAFLALSGTTTLPLSGDTAVLVADAPGTVYAQPAALLSPARQQVSLAEQVLQLPTFESASTLSRPTAAQEKAGRHAVENGVRTDRQRVASFGPTDIISPFHHFF